MGYQCNFLKLVIKDIQKSFPYLILDIWFSRGPESKLTIFIKNMRLFQKGCEILFLFYSIFIFIQNLHSGIVSQIEYIKTGCICGSPIHFHNQHSKKKWLPVSAHGKFAIESSLVYRQSIFFIQH